MIHDSFRYGELPHKCCWGLKGHSSALLRMPIPVARHEPCFLYRVLCALPQVVQFIPSCHSVPPPW